MLLFLLVFGAFLAVALAAGSVLMAGDERREVRLALRNLNDYQLPANVREQELLSSMRERVLLPVVGQLSRFSARFTPAGYKAQIREKLVHAGSPAGLDADRFMAFKVIGAVSGPFWFWFAFSFAALGGFYAVIVTGLLWAISFFGPDVWVQRKIDERQVAIALKLPDILDLLVISVEAGLGFEQAIDRTIDAGRGVPPDAPGNPRRCDQGRRPACDGRADQRAGASVVHPGHAPGRHLRCVDRSDPPLPGGRDAGPAPAACAGAGSEGPGEDALPADLLHLPVALHGHPRPGRPQHHQVGDRLS
jgi:hypothetical protein